MFREEWTAGSSCWCGTIVSCHSCHEADCPSLFSFSVSLDYFDPPHTHRHLEDLLRGSPYLQQTLLIKCQVPRERHLSRPSVPDRCEKKPLRRLLSLTLAAASQSALTLNSNSGLERWTMNTACFTLEGPKTGKHQHQILTDKNKTSPGCTFHGKEYFTVTF